MATFTPRLTRGNIYDANNPYYRLYNSFPYTYDTGMPNCTAYSYGRWNEIRGVNQNPYWGFYGNGGDWFNEGVNLGYQYSTAWKPQVGALISWDDGDAGHVAVVEAITYDANSNPVSILTSNQFWRREYSQGTTPANVSGCAPNFEWQDPTTGGGVMPGFPFFFLDTINASDPTQSTHVLYGRFNGFIYHPDFPPDVPPSPPTPFRKSIALWAISKPNRIRRTKRWQ